MKKSLTIQNMALCAMFTALIAIGAFIRIPVPVVPFTLQYLFTMLAGLLLGKKLGAFSCFLYMALGLIGIPIFTQGGGLSYVLKPSFGYIIGFCFSAWAIGSIAHKVPNPSYKRLLAANFVGMAVLYSIGTVYYGLISNFYLGNPMALWPLLLHCCLLVFPGDAVCCVLAAILSKRLMPYLHKHKIIQN